MHHGWYLDATAYDEMITWKVFDAKYVKLF